MVQILWKTGVPKALLRRLDGMIATMAVSQTVCATTLLRFTESYLTCCFLLLTTLPVHRPYIPPLIFLSRRLIIWALSAIDYLGQEKERCWVGRLCSTNPKRNPSVVDQSMGAIGIHRRKSCPRIEADLRTHARVHSPLASAIAHTFKHDSSQRRLRCPLGLEWKDIRERRWCWSSAT